jgi:hypothetical protein
MTAQHTPGPWTRIAGERFKHDHSAGVRAPDGNYIACALDRNRYDKDEEVEANARLIAAAPEMLRLLTAASHALRSYQYGNSATDPAKDVADLIDAVLVTVRGES